MREGEARCKSGREKERNDHGAEKANSRKEITLPTP